MIHENDKDINLKEQSFSDLTTHYDNLVSYNDVKDIFLSKKETFGNIFRHEWTFYLQCEGSWKCWLSN